MTTTITAPTSVANTTQNMAVTKVELSSTEDAAFTVDDAATGDDEVAEEEEEMDVDRVCARDAPFESAAHFQLDAHLHSIVCRSGSYCGSSKGSGHPLSPEINECLYLRDVNHWAEAYTLPPPMHIMMD